MIPTINGNIYHLYKHRSGMNHISSLEPKTAKEVQRTIFSVRGGRRLGEKVVSQTISP